MANSVYRELGGGIGILNNYINQIVLLLQVYIEVSGIAGQNYVA